MMGRTTRTVLACRGADSAEIVGRIEAASPRRHRPRGPVPVASVRRVQRLLCGFQNPFRESALTVLVLRTLGYPAVLVVGYEPVPTVGDRRLVSWLEVDGKAEGTGVPVQAFYPQLWRFPAL